MSHSEEGFRDLLGAAKAVETNVKARRRRTYMLVLSAWRWVDGHHRWCWGAFYIEKHPQLCPIASFVTHEDASVSAYRKCASTLASKN